MNNSDGFVRAVLLADSISDRRIVRDVFRKSGWELHEVADGREALQCAVREKAHVVIAEGTGWEALLDDLRQLHAPPQLVVTSRTADDHLWAAVLNHGGFDVLPQPFDRDELRRVVASAGRHSTSARHGMLSATASPVG